MKPIPTEMQEKIKFIPILNGFVPVFWLYNCLVTKTSHITVWKSFLLILGIWLPFSLLNRFLGDLFPSAEGLFYVVTSYFLALAVAQGIIVYQQKIISKA